MLRRTMDSSGDPVRTWKRSNQLREHQDLGVLLERLGGVVIATVIGGNVVARPF
jgi:hypothetical protein